MPWVYIRFLEMGELQLAGRGIVTVWAQEHVGKAQLSSDLQESLGLMVLGAVHDDHRVSSPAWPL